MKNELVLGLRESPKHCMRLGSQKLGCSTDLVGCSHMDPVPATKLKIQ